MQRVRRYSANLIVGLTAYDIAAGLLIVGLITFLIGIINKHCICSELPNPGQAVNDTIRDFYANVTVDCFSIAFAILVLNRLSEQRAKEQLKKQLIREIANPDNGIAIKALNELRRNYSLKQGALAHQYLPGANLQGVVLDYANLEGVRLFKANLEDARLWGCILKKASLLSANLTNADLSGCNLRGAIVSDEQLVVAKRLLGAILPDGSQYDGRLTLSDDLRLAQSIMKMSASKIQSSFGLSIEECQRAGITAANITDVPQAMAHFYKVPLDVYLEGQEWARHNLARVRRWAGLDPKTGESLPSKNRHKRNQHKSSMVAHRVQRSKQ